MRFLRNLLFLALIIGISVYAYKKWQDRNAVKGNGNETVETQTLEAFDKVQLKGHYEVTLAQGDENLLAIRTDENLQKFVNAEVEDETLRVWSENKIRKGSKIGLTITSPDFKRIEASGSVELDNAGTLKVDDLIVEISGACNTKLKLEATRFSADVSGAGKIGVEGKADEARLEVSGAGGIDAENFEVKKLTVEMSGAGGGNVHATESLDVEVSGAGILRYKGSPDINKRISGAGSVKPLDE